MLSPKKEHNDNFDKSTKEQNFLFFRHKNTRTGFNKFPSRQPYVLLFFCLKNIFV